MRKIKMLFLITIFFLVPKVVYAESQPAPSTKNYQICINTGNSNKYYSINSRDIGNKVKLNLINYNDINGSKNSLTNVEYPSGCFCSTGEDCLITGTNNCKPEYSFSSEDQGIQCVINKQDDSGYEFELCPTTAISDAFSNIQEYMEFNGKNYIIKYDLGSYQNKILAKSVKKSLETDNDVKFMDPDNPSNYEYEYSPTNLKNGIEFKPGSSFYLVFFLSDPTSGCNGIKLGYIQSSVPETVPNPEYNKKQCIDWRKGHENGTIGASLVQECYEEQIRYSELSTIESTINKKIEAAKTIFEQITSSDDKNLDFNCKFENNNANINVNNNYMIKTDWLNVAGTGTYWGALCTETLSIEYDDPKAVKSGAGFSYNAKIVVKRECTPKQLKKVIDLPVCKYRVSVNGKEHGDAPAAGPNDIFDQCISQCDNGLYTQNCINSCYNQIYNSSNRVDGLSMYSTNNNKSLIERISNLYDSKSTKIEKQNPPITYGGSNAPIYGYVLKYKREDKNKENPIKIPISSQCVIGGLKNDSFNSNCNIKCISPDDKEKNCKTEHGVSFHYGTGCDADKVLAYEVYKNYPCRVINVKEDGKTVESTEYYETELQKSSDEYDAIIAAIKEFNEDTTKQEKYNMIIDEEYDKQKDDSYLSKTTKFSNNESKKENKISVKTSISEPKTTTNDPIEIVDLGDKLSNNLSEDITKKKIYTYSISRTVELDIGAAYVSKYNGNDVKYNQTNNQTDQSLDKDEKYYSAQNKYFTNLATRFVNDYRQWPYYNEDVKDDSTDQYTKNIHVNLYNIGSWNQWGKEADNKSINIACLYGTDPGMIDDGGIRYIFRPIKLTDMFPNNRNPRWNWTDKASLSKDNSLYGTAINPSKLIETIQSKGESIYDVSTDSSEIDYEFVLTKENIRNIRSYNKHIRDYNGDGEKNYLDYNMSCYKNSRGQEICTSKFLDNIDGNSGSDENTDSKFITYSVGGYGITERKSIAGCNNAKNGECDTTAGN